MRELIQLASSGRTSVPVDPAFRAPLYRVVGYRVAGNRAVRVDILERLADLIRPLIAWRPTPEARTRRDGAVDGNGFRVTVDHDVAPRLLRRGFRVGAPRAGLPRRAPAGAAAGRSEAAAAAAVEAPTEAGTTPSEASSASRR